MCVVWKTFELREKENWGKDFVEIINGNVELISELRNIMSELENKGRGMESLDFCMLKNYNVSEFFNYMMKHKVWITKSNFEKAKENVRSFDKIILKAKAMRKEQDLMFYLSEDEKN
jgi:hypothetical protein